nr:RNA-directed DNA polymerase, eukaryota, reverse transcriptase zinc-binding domain protein [Tanacetum cinerariifolium]
MVFKVDFAKAYDSIRWDYLDYVLRSFGFGSKWSSWISGSLTSRMASILINGSLTSEFQFHCGLKQGDPLAPYLFILIMESLHLSFSRAVDAGIFTGIKIDYSLTISHIFYADDAVFIGEWSNANLNGDERKITWVKWSKVLALKKYGGLGVSSYYAFNRALLFKWVWRFISQVNSLWCRFITSMHGSQLLKLSLFHSSTWNTIIQEINVLKSQGVDLISHCKIRVGNGMRTQFWNETWVGDTQLRYMFPRIYALEVNKDIWVWDLNGEGVFHVKDVRNLLDESFLSKDSTATRLVKSIPTKINVFAWKVYLDRLPTRLNLIRRGVQPRWENDLGKLFTAPDFIERLASDKSSNSTSSTNTNPKGRNRRGSKQRVENSNLEEHFPPVVTMADQRTMAELLRAPTEGYAEAIVVTPTLVEQFELKHSLTNMMTTDQFFELEKDNPHDHIRWFNKITSTIEYKDVPNSLIKLILFPFSLIRAAYRTTNLRNEISNFQQRFDESFHEAWDRYKDLLRVCPHHSFTELHKLDTFYNALNPTDQDSLNAAAGGNLLERSTQDVLTIIENKSKARNSRSKQVDSQVKACDVNYNSEIAKLTHVVNQQTSDVTTTMMAMLKQFQATPPPAPIKAVEEICVTCGGAHLYYQCFAAGGNTFPELRDNIQGYVSAVAVNYNQGSGSLSSNTVANPKGELKAITTRSGLVIDGPTVPPPTVQKYKPPSQIEFIVHKKDPLYPNIPYPSRMLKQKQQEKDKVQIQIFWQMFKQLHINITLADALILMPKYQKMLKALLSNKEKLQELANTPLNENCSAVILKKLPE